MQKVLWALKGAALLSKVTTKLSDAQLQVFLKNNALGIESQRMSCKSL